MIDPLISLAFAMHAKKGAYALLLGSGVSRASGIPTGWEVVLELIRKVAKLSDEDCGSEPEGWFKRKFGESPNYSKLLESLSRTAIERQQILREYFEPTEEERASNLKVPTAAHRAIAKLIASEYVKIVVTTNFDRLLELALQDVGIVPTVISTADHISGSLPLAHSGVTIIKIHGDYTDSRIRNTEEEVGKYDTKLDTLLDRVFDEYGLIVAGWSADWDIALRAAIERCASRRFSTFWATRSPLSAVAKKVVDSRRAEVVEIKDADSFFQQVAEKVFALADLRAPHPLSAKMASATVKRYLVDSSARIRLHDLVHEETEKLVDETTTAKFPPSSTKKPEEELMLRLQRYESIADVLVAMFIAGSHWSDRQQSTIWAKALARTLNAPPSEGGTVYLLELRYFPSLLLLYAGGISALAANAYENLHRLFAVKFTKNAKPEPSVARLNAHAVFHGDIGKLIAGKARNFTPVSDYLFEKLRDPLREYLPDDEQYQETFDRFEYLMGLTYADQLRRPASRGWRGPVGCFTWRRFSGSGIPSLIAGELETTLDRWPPVQAGMFGGSVDQARKAISQYNEFLTLIQFH